MSREGMFQVVGELRGKCNSKASDRLADLLAEIAEAEPAWVVDEIGDFLR